MFAILPRRFILTGAFAILAGTATAATIQPALTGPLRASTGGGEFRWTSKVTFANPFSVQTYSNGPLADILAGTELKGFGLPGYGDPLLVLPAVGDSGVRGVFGLKVSSLTASTTSNGMFAVAGFGVARGPEMKDRMVAFSLSGQEGGFDYSVEMTSNAVQSRSSNVPDGGSTLALLGVALLGLQGGRRLLRIQKI